MEEEKGEVMAKAKDVAVELRRIADSLEQEPDAEVERPSLAWFLREKESMQTLARILPHPLKKDVEDPARSFSSIKITAESCTAICVYASIERSRICRLVRPAQPAEYECEPLLSEDEEEALEIA